MKRKKKYIPLRDRGLFDTEDRLQSLDAVGDPLDNLNRIMDWSVFTPVLDRIPVREPKGPGGRPAFEPGFMFRILVLQSLYNLSDAQTQYQILDRRSFHRFLGITDADTVPDQNTIRLFRETLTGAGLLSMLFDGFRQRLESRGFITRKGQIVDATFVEVPRQRNTPEENAAIKRGEVPVDLEKDPNRLSHKDMDARWAKKNNDTYYGYKNHVNVDLESKLIIAAAVTDASVHDSQALDAVTSAGDGPTFMDSAYTGAACAEVLEKKQIKGYINEKGARGKPLSEDGKLANRLRSKFRSRVEHVFAFMENSMGALYRRSIGMKRAQAGIMLANLVYNICRTEQIMRLRLMGNATPAGLL